MSLSTCAALVRNAGCVAKTLLPKAHFLQKVVPLPFLNNVKLVETVIAPAQALGVAYNVYNGYNDIINGLNDLKQHSDQLASFDGMTNNSGGAFLPEGSVEAILRQGIVSSRKGALMKVFVGLCKFVIGCGFVFLVMNTLHINPPNHPVPLFKAVSCIETALFSLLVIMLKGIFDSFSKSKKLGQLASIFNMNDGGKMNARQRLNAAVATGGFGNNFYDALQLVDSSFATPAFKKGKNSSGQEALQQDLSTLKNLLRVDNIAMDSYHLAADLSKQAYDLFMNTVFDSIYFVLNFIAFYGYLMGVMAFFVPGAESPVATGVKSLIHRLLFKLPNEKAMDLGFLAGDVAWTIEPALAMMSPFILKAFAKRREDKMKKNA
jgi:hypothetical protein